MTHESAYYDTQQRKENALAYLKKQKEDNIKGIIYILIFLAVSLLLYFIFEWFIFVIVALLIVAILIYALVHDLPRTERLIKEVDTNLEEVERVIADQIKTQNELEAEQARIKANAKATSKAQHAYDHPQCPMCKSHNTRRITTINRATSIAVVGLASSKIGKQYECFNCKHKW